jgi:hypothetical protein
LPGTNSQADSPVASAMNKKKFYDIQVLLSKKELLMLHASEQLVQNTYQGKIA